MDTNRIVALLEEHFMNPDWTGFFVVAVDHHEKTNKLEVFVENDGPLPLSACQTISRLLEASLDEHQWLGEKYILEVSSPGVSRPLQLPRQYVKNIGRKLEVVQKDGSMVKGLLAAANEASFQLTFDQTIKEGKKKRTDKIILDIPYDQVNKAVVKISFS